MESRYCNRSEWKAGSLLEPQAKRNATELFYHGEGTSCSCLLFAGIPHHAAWLSIDGPHGPQESHFLYSQYSICLAMVLGPQGFCARFPVHQGQG